MAEGSPSVNRAQLVTAAELRAFMGSTSNDLPDTQANAAVMRGQRRVLRDVTTWHDQHRMRGAVDGQNTTYWLSKDVASRVFVDDDLSLVTDADDVLVESLTWTDGVPVWATLTVSSVDATHGQVTLASAPASLAVSVHFTGRAMRRRITRETLNDLFLYASALEASPALQAPGAIRLANPTKGAPRTGPRQDWQKQYADAKRHLVGGKPRAASRELRGHVDEDTVIRRRLHGDTPGGEL